MLERFLKIRDQLLEVQIAENGDIYIDGSQRLRNTTEKFMEMLQKSRLL